MTVQKAINTTPNVDIDGVGGHYNLAEQLAIDGNGTPQQLTTNQNLVLLPSAARTSTSNGPQQTNINSAGIAIFLNVTAASGTGGLTVALEGQDPISGVWVTIFLATVAVTATGLFSYYFYPGISTSQGTQSASLVLPAAWRVSVVHGDGSNYVYSVGGSLILAS